MTERNSSISPTTGCFSAISARVVSSVEYDPLAFFFGLSISPSLSNSTSPICFGEETFSSGSPASSLTLASREAISVCRWAVYSFSEPMSIRTPFLSIFESTFVSGSSISEYIRFIPSLSRASESLLSSSRMIAASRPLSSGVVSSYPANSEPVAGSEEDLSFPKVIPRNEAASESSLWLFSGSRM